MMVHESTTFAAEWRPKADRGYWRLYCVCPTEAEAWDTLLKMSARDRDLRVRRLARRTAAGVKEQTVEPSLFGSAAE